MNQGLRIGPITRRRASPMIGKHYLHRWPGVVRLTLGLFDGLRPVGLIVFAEPPRETKVRYGGDVWELARLWVHDDMPRNTETWFIARAIRQIRHIAPRLTALVSYADPSAGHTGTIYKAGNWQSDGRTDAERKTPRFDYVDGAGKVYSRRAHVPSGIEVARKPRVSKYRFVYWLKEPASKKRVAL